MVTCDLCGASPPRSDGQPDNQVSTDRPLPLTWVTSVENGRPRVYCDRCARENLRGIEGKLDSEWW